MFHFATLKGNKFNIQEKSRDVSENELFYVGVCLFIYPKLFTGG